MSGETPAKHLARVKVSFQQWTIRPVEPGKGTGYTAQHRDTDRGLRSIYAPDLASLEIALAEAQEPQPR